jgi:hypothetical protein
MDELLGSDNTGYEPYHVRNMAFIGLLSGSAWPTGVGDTQGRQKRLKEVQIHPGKALLLASEWPRAFDLVSTSSQRTCPFLY